MTPDITLVYGPSTTEIIFNGIYNNFPNTFQKSVIE